MQLNLTDAVTQANLPKKYNFNHTALSDYLKACNINVLKMDLTTIQDSSLFKTPLHEELLKIKKIK